MRSGPKAILYQSCLYRTSELVWIKVAPLEPWRQAVRWSLIACGLAFFVVMAQAKGTWINAEGLLGLLAWHVGYCLQPEVRLGSSGDLQESYEARGGSGSSTTFRQWVNALSESDNECKVQSTHYQHWFNLERIAWAGGCWLVEWYPLVLAPVFLAYHWVLGQEWVSQIANQPMVSDIHLFTFENSSSFVHFLCWLISFLGVAAWATSVKQGVEVRASGGLFDRFALNSNERKVFYDRLAGHHLASPPEKVKVASLPQPAPVALAPKSEPAPAPKVDLDPSADEQAPPVPVEANL